MDIDPGRNIDPEDVDERQARLDWMIDEFRTAQTRRRIKTNDTSAKSQEASVRNAAVTGTTTSP